MGIEVHLENLGPTATTLLAMSIAILATVLAIRGITIRIKKDD